MRGLFGAERDAAGASHRLATLLTDELCTDASSVEGMWLDAALAAEISRRGGPGSERAGVWEGGGLSRGVAPANVNCMLGREARGSAARLVRGAFLPLCDQKAPRPGPWRVHNRMGSQRATRVRRGRARGAFAVLWKAKAPRSTAWRFDHRMGSQRATGPSATPNPPPPHPAAVGVGEPARLWLIDPALDPGPAPSGPVRRHCGHEVAFAALTGIHARLIRDGDGAGACRAARLRGHLPVGRHE